MRKLYYGLAAAAVIILSGCGTQSSAPKTTTSSKAVKPPAKSHQHTAKSTPNKPESKPLVTVKKPWRSGVKQKGIAIYWQSWGGETIADQQKAAGATFDYAVKLGANSVSLSFPFYTDGMNGNTVYSRQSTPMPRALAAVLKEANRRHLRVTVRPLLDEANLMIVKNGWRGSIEPTDRGAWFASYERFLKPYLVVAQTQKAATFCVAVELDSLADDSAWKQLIVWAKRYYHGELLYSANWNDVNVAVGHDANRLGLDAYFGTTLSDSATTKELTEAWGHWLTGLRLSGTRAVISEVGIAAEAGAYQHPYGWGSSSVPLKVDIQTRWFLAACRAFKNSGLAGIYFWRLNFSNKPTTVPKSDRDGFAGRPAAKVVQQCFQSI